MASYNAIEWSEEMDQAIKLNETSYEALAAQWGVLRSSVSRRAKALGTSSSMFPDWGSQDIEILKTEWEKGTPTSVIGNMIGKTKNAVIGKAHRLKLSSRKIAAPRKKAETTGAIKQKAENFVKRLKVPKPKTERSLVPKPPRPIAALKPLSEREPITIMELNSTTCKAPVGNDPNTGLITYCGDFVSDPCKSFCPGHYALYYRAPDRRYRI